MTNQPNESDRRLREAVFRRMFESDYVRVARYVERNMGDRAVAEDIAADVFQVAWQKLDPADPFGLPWLIRTAMHKMRDHQRRHYRGAVAMSAVARLVQEPPESLESIDRIALYDAMKRLSAKDLEIVRLTYWDRLTAGEVAAVLRMKEGAIWTRLHRARSALRAALDAPSGPGVDT